MTNEEARAIAQELLAQNAQTTRQELRDSAKDFHHTVASALTGSSSQQGATNTANAVESIATIISWFKK
ncbi:MAG: hypothetical protein SGJ04_09860 [Bacteroidota bacterium]|nr:hypothetical protein [Bacteroidota bacterium]